MSERVSQVSVESIATAVTSAVAEAESCGLLELPPLYNRIDLEALESFCSHALGATDNPSVSFTYSESLVSIDRGDVVTVSAAPATEEAVTDTFTRLSEDAGSTSDD